LGFLIGWESLLSTHGSENGMLGDMLGALVALRGLTVVFERGADALRPSVAFRFSEAAAPELGGSMRDEGGGGSSKLDPTSSFRQSSSARVSPVRKVSALLGRASSGAALDRPTPSDVRASPNRCREMAQGWGGHPAATSPEKRCTPLSPQASEKSGRGSPSASDSSSFKGVHGPSHAIRANSGLLDAGGWAARSSPEPSRAEAVLNGPVEESIEMVLQLPAVEFDALPDALRGVSLPVAVCLFSQGANDIIA
jgi:hypothetical protein